jgi:hypothetical protein
MTRAGSFVRAVALLAGGLVASTPLASQAPESRRLKIADTGLPGIDLGRSLIARPDAIGGRERLRDERAARAPYVGGRILVKFRDRDQAEVVPIDPDANPEDMAQRYAARGDVEFAQADYRARLLFRPNDPLFSSQWNLSALRMEQAWDIQRGASSAVVVAVHDTGMAYDTAT